MNRDQASRVMFVARLQNARADLWTGNAVLGLLDECDMLASREVPAESSPSLREASLELAAATFQHYGFLHIGKHTPDGIAKAEANFALAAQMRAALAEAPVPQSELTEALRAARHYLAGDDTPHAAKLLAMIDVALRTS